MFNNLLESKPQKQRSTGGSVLSMVFHTVLIYLAVQATLQAHEEKENVEESVSFVEVKKDEPPPPKPPPQEAPPPPPGFQVLTAPVNIPDVLPEIDLTARITNEADFSGKGVQQKVASQGPVAKPDGDQPYFEFMVEKPVTESSNTQRPRYPDILKSAGVEGEVLAQFVVDTTGHVEINTFKVLKTSHELFAAAVRSALPGMRFIPAEVGQKRVRQLVQQPFVFAIAK
ncbi:MAG: TonB family protein [Gemmatimonadetes bacterium]|nr:TonB family protein [Gemmatimonadota bacterium]